MTTSLQKGQPKRSNVLKKINVEGNVDERQEVMVCCKTATLKWKGFESQMVIWRKMYGLDGQREIEMIDMKVFHKLK